ncbi:uncharacterized protein EURHEDRAFT_218288 [Aspergillus ruber CBS 135680]|uniref:Uncharacterized protein n=1 Tax=Aspergillus ruber (strain CBS 135680) TaxID=1388766 RepID=A0A017SQS6_ASPRC|nr:uncharacterized protein EURHEDRAFT_218288 [Aspergillus ruber CBS 135680]EYE98600.1 hypothetical protein EURHEDRAFT_218288 [Aspergillus ruber CBS 135680]
MERTNLTKDAYCLTNVHAHTQLIECLIYNKCAHVDYKNLLASLLGPTIYSINLYQSSQMAAAPYTFLLQRILLYATSSYK